MTARMTNSHTSRVTCMETSGTPMRMKVMSATPVTP